MFLTIFLTMFLTMFFSCDVEAPTLAFENQGKGELWQGGTIVSTEVETDGDPDQETTNTEDVNDTGNDTSDTPESGTNSIQDTGE